MNLLKNLTVDTKALEKEREEKCGARRRRPRPPPARARAHAPPDSRPFLSAAQG